MNKVLGVAAAVALFATPPAFADVTAKDVQVIGRSLGFLTEKPSGRLTVAIIHAPSVPESQKEAEGLKSLLGDGLAAGAVTLVPALVPVDTLAGLETAGIAFVTGGLGPRHAAIFDATKGRKMLSVTTDPACIQAAKCVMSVKAEPKVEIIVSKAAADASQVAFQPAFRMMITEQ